MSILNLVNEGVVNMIGKQYSDGKFISGEQISHMYLQEQDAFMGTLHRAGAGSSPRPFHDGIQSATACVIETKEQSKFLEASSTYCSRELSGMELFVAALDSEGSGYLNQAQRFLCARLQPSEDKPLLPALSPLDCDRLHEFPGDTRIVWQMLNRSSEEPKVGCISILRAMDFDWKDSMCKTETTIQIQTFSNAHWLPVFAGEISGMGVESGVSPPSDPLNCSLLQALFLFPPPFPEALLAPVRGIFSEENRILKF